MAKINNDDLSMKVQSTFKLSDGTIVGVGLAGPEDEERFLRGFRKLSQKSRFLRFHFDKQELSKSEKNYLLNIDNVNHLAIGAVDLSKSHNVGIGLARYIREKENPTRADAAITVIDEYQNKGIGTYLFRELIIHADKNRVRILTSFVLKENNRMIKILEKF